VKPAGNNVAAKYLWAATYHNTLMGEACKGQFTKRGFAFGNYLIWSDEMPMAYEL
jgi:hypothetical protein